MRFNHKGFAALEIIMVVVVLAVIGFVALLILGPHNSKKNQAMAGDNPAKSNAQSAAHATFNENDLPKFIQADFIDLSKVYDVSKFRSGAGHDYTAQSDETCRSMKHYFSPPPTAQPSERKAASLKNQKAAPPDAAHAIDIFSPVDGTLTNFEELPTTGYDLQIKPAQQPDYIVRISHSYPIAGLKKGSSVTAGRKIAIIGTDQDVDMAVTFGKQTELRYVSYFQVMSDKVFAKYQALGAKQRSDFVISREYRDAHPLKCVSGSQDFSPDNDLSAPIERNVVLHP